MSFAAATQEVSNSSHIVEWQLLADVPDEALHALLTIARRRTFARGEVVFHRGDPADSLNLIRKGRFSVLITTPLGDTAMLSVRGPGDAFGELALLGREPARSATVSALEPAETHSVYRDDFERLRHEHPIVNDVLIGILTDRLRRLSDQLVEAYYVPADRRVLRRMCELTEQYRAERRRGRRPAHPGGDRRAGGHVSGDGEPRAPRGRAARIRRAPAWTDGRARPR